jgi:hypothetical protein
MAQQTINIGAAPNDGTGDNPRAAFDKANQNFTELYAADATLQPLDADLTALAALTGTNTIYYRNAANSWAAVTIGTNLTFTGGTLNATGGGDVFKASANTFTAQNCFTGFGVVAGHTASISNCGVEVHGLNATLASIDSTLWQNNSACSNFAFNKSRGTTVGSHVAVAASDNLGEIHFRGSTGSVFAAAAYIRGIANGAPIAGTVPGAIQVFAYNAAGSLVQVAGLSTTTGCNFIGSTVAAPPLYVGEYIEYTASPSSALGAGAYTTCMTQSIGPGDWDIQGIVRVSGTAGAYMYLTIHTGAGSSGTPLNTQTGILTGLADCWTATPMVRVLLTTATNYQINCYMSAAGTLVQVMMTLRRRH